MHFKRQQKIRFTLLLTIGLLLFQVVISKPLNYTPKTLVKDLAKNFNVNIDDLLEIKHLSEQLITDGKFFQMKDEGYVFIGRVISCRAGGCSADRKMPADGAYEYFDAYIIYDKHKEVKSLRVFNYQATHGHEITSKGWLKQFIGYDGSKAYEVGKDVDSISGATISVYAITDEVNYITTLLKNY